MNYSETALAEITPWLDSLAKPQLKELEAAVAAKLASSEREDRAEAIAEIHRIAARVGMTPEQVLEWRKPYTRRNWATPA